MGTVVDIVIGLAFVFALVALICTALQEWLSAALNLRGKTLWEGVQSMLLANNKPTNPPDPGCQLGHAIGQHAQIKGLVPDKFGPIELVRWLFGWRQPSAETGSTKPSYLEAGTFATVLADAIGELWKGGGRRYDDFGLAVAAMPEGPLKQQLLRMVEEAAGDPARLRAAVEAWFNETMQRVGGWYKRRVQVLLMAIGLVVAGGMNVDAIHIATSLATQPALRDSLAARAVLAAEEERVTTKAAKSEPAASAAASETKSLEQAQQDTRQAMQTLQSLNLPIGWDGGGRQVNTFTDGFLLALGWLATALAASFGAPFWFDLISRLSPLRAAGTKPSTADSDTAATTAASKPGTNAIPASPATTAKADTASPFRDALNDYEAHGISEEQLVRVKKMLGIDGPNALRPLLDQMSRDAIQARQALKGWPATGELSGRWVQALFAGGA